MLSHQSDLCADGNMDPEDVVNFAVASSVMKHSIRGDTNITSVAQIKSLMNNASFDVQR